MRVVLAAFLLSCATLGNAAGAAGEPASSSGMTLVWEDSFNPDEKAMLTDWVNRTRDAVTALIGPYPMDVRVHFHRRDGAGEPVPWAHTQRQPGQAVHLHVDPAFKSSAFLDDWTAPHEFSHLMLPYVGRRHAWFAEGFASYLQYKVMVQLGVMAAADARSRAVGNMDRAERDYPYPDIPFVAAAPRLQAERKYPVMYWGGAAYVEQVDRMLQRQGTSVIETLRRYVACCRQNRDSLDGLLAALDRLSGSDAFRTCYRLLRSTPGFPDYRLDSGG